MDRSARLNSTSSEASQEEHGVTPSESGFPQLIGRIASYQSGLSPKDAKKYRLALFLRIVKRVAEFAPDCEECRTSETQLRQLADYLAQVPMPKFWRKAYFGGMDRRLRHLRRRHRLVMQGENTSFWIGVGIALGLALGTLLDAHVCYGAAIGLLVGAATGVTLDARAWRHGKVI